MGIPPRKAELPLPPVQGFGNDPSRLAAATMAYGAELGRALPDDVDVHQLLDDEPTRPHQIVSEPVSEPTASQRAVLEPVSEDAHPVEHVRMATQPALASEALAAARELEPMIPPLTATPMVERVPEPPAAVRRSPSPVQVGIGLFSADPITNWLAGAAIGLVLTIIPAERLARAHAHELLNQPMLELKDSIDHPLAVDVGLLRKPKLIAAEIEDARAAVRTRYLMIWLLVGLPIGLGLGFAPRWWT